MKLEQLVHVVEVANTQSISKAASNLLLSQPGLSNSIKQLECELGADLFIRSKKGVELTPVGSSFVMYAKKVLDQVRSIEKLCKEEACQVFQTLSVAACHFRYASVAVAMMMRKHKQDGARFVLRNGITNDCVDWVADGICDVGLVYFRADEEKAFRKLMQLKQLQYKVIYQTDAKVIVGRGNPLYHTDLTEIDARELTKYPMIAHDQTTAKDYFRSVFLHTQAKNVRAIITDGAAMREMLQYTDGYSMGLANDIVYRNIPQQEDIRSLKVVGSSSTTRKVAWIASANMASMPLANEFILLLTQLCTDPDFAQKHPECFLQ